MGAGFFDWFRPLTYSPRRDRTTSSRSRSTARLSTPANLHHSSGISVQRSGLSYDDDVDDHKHHIPSSSPYTTTPYHTVGAASSATPSSTNSASVFGIASGGGTKNTLNLSPTPTSGFKYNSTRGHNHPTRSPTSTASTVTTPTTAGTGGAGTQPRKAPSTSDRYQQQVETKQTPRRHHQQYQQYQQHQQHQQQREQERLNRRTSEEVPVSYEQSHALGSHPPAPTDTIFSDHQQTISNQHTENLQVLVQPSVFNRSPRHSESFSDSEPVPNVSPPARDRDTHFDFDIERGDTAIDQPVSFPSVIPSSHFPTSSTNGQPRSVKSDQIALGEDSYARKLRKGKSKHKIIDQETKLFQRQQPRRQQQQQQQVDQLDSNHIQLLHESEPVPVPVVGLRTEVENEETKETRKAGGGNRREDQGYDKDKITEKNDDSVPFPRRHSKGVNYKKGKTPSRSSSLVPGVNGEFSPSASLTSSYSPGSRPLRDESFELFVPHHPGDRDLEDTPISTPLPRAPLVTSQKSSHSTRRSRHRAGVVAATSSVSPPSSLSSVSTSADPSSTRPRRRAPLPQTSTAVPPPSTSPPPPLPFESIRGDQSEHFHSKPQSAKAGSTSIDRASASIYTSPQTGSTGVSISRTDTNSFRSSRGSREPLLPGQRTTRTPKYFRVFRGGQNRFTIRSKSDRNREQEEHQKKQAKATVGPPLDAVPPLASLESVDPSTSNFGIAREDAIFGTQEQVEERKRRLSDIRPGEQELITFIRKFFGSRAENLAIGLMNKSPITSPSNFVHRIHQGTEDSDLDIIRRDLDPNILFKKGVRLLGGGWSNLLLGDRFAPERSTRQKHELIYCRSACSCLICLVREADAAQVALSDGFSVPDVSDGADSLRTSNMDMLSSTSTARTPLHSAMANFVELYGLPRNPGLLRIGGKSTPKELEIGSVIRLNLRTSAKLKFTDDVRELFGHLAYTGPISHEDVFRKVTTIGVQYYMFNKGKKERKVYIKGELICIPINVGVAKLRTQPLFRSELGSTYLLYRKQQLSIYVGELVLEGNSIGSFINTGLRYYIGFGEERGVCPVYPNKNVGKARKLGINELLLHHHMVDDLEIKCL